MTKGFSVCLDLVRFSAALWVALAHFQAWGFVPAPLARWMPASGRDAVVLFFVLSGYVIAHSVRTKTASAYGIERLARIYSVAIPVVLLSTCAAFIAVENGFLDADLIYPLQKMWLYLALYFSFLGDAWSLREFPHGIIPYWSLNYEFWYYVLFGILLYLQGAWRLALLAAVLLLVGYKLWLLWPLWLAGAWLHANSEKWAIGQGTARGLMLASAVAYLCIEAAHIDTSLWRAGDAWLSGLTGLRLGNARFFLADYLVGVLAVAHFHGARYANLRFPAGLTPAIRWLAGFTFTLYLGHGPLLHFWQVFGGPIPQTAAAAVALFVGMLLGVVALGYVTERQLPLWRAIVAGFFVLGEIVWGYLRRRVVNLRLIRSHR